MKKGLISLSVLLGSAILAQAKGPADPVLMTVGGKPVTLSEFEYLYHKNNAQQSTPQDIEEYLKLFIPYRQKVPRLKTWGLTRPRRSQRNSTLTVATWLLHIWSTRPWRTASSPPSMKG